MYTISTIVAQKGPIFVHNVLPYHLFRFDFVSFRFVSFRFDLFRFDLVSFRFVSFRFDLFRFVPFRFCFVSHFTGTHDFLLNDEAFWGEEHLCVPDRTLRDIYLHYQSFLGQSPSKKTWSKFSWTSSTVYTIKVI